MNVSLDVQRPQSSVSVTHAIDPVPATAGFVRDLSRWIERRFSSKGKFSERVREGVEQ
jgi:hypothetical protein